LLAVLVVSTCLAAPELPRPYRLPRHDLAELANLVCTTRHAVPEDRIAAWLTPSAPHQGPFKGQTDSRANNQPNDRRGNLRATVDCKPHQVTEQFAVFFAAECERTTSWQCGRSEVRVRVDVDQHPLVIHANGYKPELIYSLISKIVNFRTRNGDPVITGSTRQCSLIGGPSRDLLDLTCDEQLIRLSYWCPQSSCPRIFSIGGYFVPADAGGL
jgi:hypothetical protein